MTTFQFTPDGGAPYPIEDDDVQTVQDRAPMRGVEVVFQNRDGGDIQDQGVGIAQHVFGCYYSGPEAEKRYRALNDAIERQRRGELQHPLLGSRRAWCSGIDQATVNWQQETETITFSIGFKRDGSNATAVQGNLPSVQKATSTLNSVTTQGLVATTAIAQRIAGPNATDAVLQRIISLQMPTVPQLFSRTAQFALTALSAVGNQVASFALSGWRNQVRELAGEAMAQVRALGIPDVVTQPLIAQIASAVSATDQVYETARSQGPQPEILTVQQPTPVAAVAARAYGARGLARVDEIRRNNNLRGFGVPGGTKLRLLGPLREQR